MISMEQREALQALGTALRREVDELVADPELLWQQLYNRLQWDEHASVVVEEERRRQVGQGEHVWLRRRTPLLESPALQASVPTGVPVAASAVSPDGDYFVVAGGSPADGDYSVKIMDARSRRLRHAMEGHLDPVVACAVSPDGRFVVSTGPYHHQGCKYLYAWDPATGENLARHLSVAEYDGVAISPDGAWVAAPTADKDEHQVTVFGTDTWQPQWHLASPGSVLGTCAFSPDGRLLVMGGRRLEDGVGILSIRSTDGWDAMHVFTCGQGAVTAVVFSPDGSRLLAAQADVTRVMDVETWEETHRLVPLGERMSFSPDGSFLVAVQNDKVLVWDTATWEQRSTLVGHDGKVTDCDVSPDGCFILSGGQDQYLKMWDTSLALRSVETPAARTVDGVTPDAAAPTQWDFESGALGLRDAAWGDAKPVAMTPDGTILVSSNGHVIRGAEETAAVVPGVRLARGTAITPDGALVVTWSARTLTISDGVTGATLRTLEGHGGEVNDCHVSPDGRFLLSASDDCTLRVWELTSGDEVLKLLGHMPVAAAGRHNAWEAFTGQVRGVLACAWTPDGSSIVSAGADGTVRVWDGRTGRQQRVVLGVDAPMTSCAVSPDGRYVASAGDVHVLFVHRIDTGEPVAVVRGPTNVVAHHAELRFGHGRELGFEEFEAVGLECGPLVVRLAADGRTVCPACWSRLADQAAAPGTMACPSCGTSLRIPDFAAVRPRHRPLWRVDAWRRKRKLADRKAAAEKDPWQKLRDWSGGYADVETPRVPWHARLRMWRREPEVWLPGVEVYSSARPRKPLEFKRPLRWLGKAVTWLAAAMAGFLLVGSLYGSLLAVLVLDAGRVLHGVRSAPAGRLRRATRGVMPHVLIAALAAGVHLLLDNWWAAVPIGFVVGLVAALFLENVFFKDLVQQQRRDKMSTDVSAHHL